MYPAINRKGVAAEMVVYPRAPHGPQQPKFVRDIMHPKCLDSRLEAPFDNHRRRGVNGVEKPIVNKGSITVPDKPGLGVTLNEDVVKQHLLEPGYFEPTPQWNTDRTNDRQWS